MMCSTTCLFALSFGSDDVKSDSGSLEPTTGAWAHAGEETAANRIRATSAIDVFIEQSSVGCGGSEPTSYTTDAAPGKRLDARDQCGMINARSL